MGEQQAEEEAWVDDRKSISVRQCEMEIACDTGWLIVQSPVVARHALNQGDVWARDSVQIELIISKIVFGDAIEASFAFAVLFFLLHVGVD